MQINDIGNALFKYKLLHGNAEDVLKNIPKNIFHMAVTSPPYWNQRKYLFDGAVVFKDDLTKEEIEKVIKELKKYGVKPKI